MIRETINNDRVYGTPWAEFFISMIIAKLVQYFFWPTAWMLLLLPVTWLVVHALIGDWMTRNAKKDIFRRD